MAHLEASANNNNEERVVSRIVKLRPGLLNYDGLAMVMMQSFRVSVGIFVATVMGLVSLLFWVVRWAMAHDVGDQTAGPFPREHVFFVTVTTAATLLLSAASIASLLRVHRAVDKLFVNANAAEPATAATAEVVQQTKRPRGRPRKSDPPKID